MQFFKTRFFIILLCIAIVLTLVPIVWTAMGRTDLVRGAVGIAATPFKWCFNACANAIKGFGAYFTEFDRLKAENEYLKDRLEDYEEQKNISRVLDEENRWLRKYLGLKDENEHFELADATIVSKESSSSSQIFTLNRGSSDGIKVGMPVITESGVFGFVKEVSIFSCKVVGMLDASASAGAIIERSGAIGVAGGAFELRSDGLCEMSYIEAGSDVKVGDIVVTSGVGGVYPPGIKLGRVVEISTDALSRNMVATIQPYVDFENASRVMIITSFSRTSDTTTKTGMVG